MKKQSFFKSSAILLSMVVITKILGLMFKIPLTHILGGSGMGYFSAAFSVYTPVFAIVVSGIPSAMSRLAAQNFALDRYANLRRQKTAAHITFGIIAIAACLLIFALSGPLAAVVIGEKSSKYTLMCLAPSIVFCTAMSVERGYYEGLRNMLPTALSEIAETLFKLLFGLGLAMLTKDYAEQSYLQTGMVFGEVCTDYAQASNAALPYIAAAAILGSTLASGLACLLLIIGTKIKGDGISAAMRKNDRCLDSRTAHSKELIKCAVPIAFTAVITTMTGMIDMLTINPCIRLAIESDSKPFEIFTNYGISLSELPNFLYGSYEGLAMLIYGLVPTLTAMFGKSALPALAESKAKCNKRQFAASLCSMMKISSIIAIPSGLGIFAMTKPLLRFLFDGRDAEIQAAVQPLSILGISVIFFAVALPCFTILQTLGKPKKIIAVITLGGIIKLALNIILIPRADINLSGAALSELASSIFVCIVTVREMYKTAGIKCSLTETYLKPLYAGAICVLSAILVEDLMEKCSYVNFNHRIVTLFSVAIGGILYFISLYLLCETPKNLIKNIFFKKSPKNT